MKNSKTSTNLFVLTLVFLWLILLLSVQSLTAQNTQFISQFDFDSTNVLVAAVGPDAVSANPNIAIDNGAAYLSTGCGGSAGIDLQIPGNVFKRGGLCLSWNFRRFEGQFNFFELGNFRIRANSGRLFIQYGIEAVGGNGSGNGNNEIAFPEYNTGYTFPADNRFHQYQFCYDSIAGVAEFTVDGTIVWSRQEAVNTKLVWTGATYAMVGGIMDGSCRGAGYLDQFRAFPNQAQLPVEWYLFEGFRRPDHVELNWTTAKEVNNHHFDIERSLDGRNFEVIGQMAAAGNSEIKMDYGFEDVNAPANTLFYRIRQVDIDGKNELSDVVEIQGMDIQEQFSSTVYPNPTTADKGLQLNLNHNETSETRVQVLNMNGSLLYTTTVPAATSTIELNNGIQLKPGLYLVKVNHDHQTHTHKLIIQ